MHHRNTGIQVVAYSGLSLVPSKVIRWLTRSDHSHVALKINFHFDGVDSRGKPVHVTPGNVIEAWTDSMFDRGAVRLVKDESDQHTRGTPITIYDAPDLTSPQERLIAGFACRQIGKRYDWMHVFLFVPVLWLLFILKARRVTREAINEIKIWFCSRLVAGCFLYAAVPLFNDTETWRVPPDWCKRSLRLKENRRTFTT